MGLTTTDLGKGSNAPVNLVAARSGKIDRVRAGSLSAEAYSMVGAVACAEWVQRACTEMTNAAFSGEHLKKRIAEWDLSSVKQMPRLRMDGVFIYRDNADPYLRDSLAITDAKTLYDGLVRETRGKEPRVALAVGDIKQGFA